MTAKHSDFVHLHVHTQYSLLDGMIFIDRLMEQAQAFHMPAVAITDHGQMHGVIEFYRRASKAGLKPILGCELYVAPGDRREKVGRIGDIASHLTLLARNNSGYQNLVKLTTAANLEGFYYKPRVDKELLRSVRRTTGIAGHGIYTAAAIDQIDPLGLDVLIRTDAGNGLPPFENARLVLSNTRTHRLLVADCDDRCHHELGRWTRKRRRAYRERGWYGPGADPVEERVKDFLKARPMASKA